MSKFGEKRNKFLPVNKAKKRGDNKNNRKPEDEQKSLAPTKMKGPKYSQKTTS